MSHKFCVQVDDDWVCNFILVHRLHNIINVFSKPVLNTYLSKYVTIFQKYYGRNLEFYGSSNNNLNFLILSQLTLKNTKKAKKKKERKRREQEAAEANKQLKNRI